MRSGSVPGLATALHSGPTAPCGCGGDNGYGQLGDGTFEDRRTPTKVPGLDDVVAVSVGYYSHTVALRDDGTLWSWGSNFWGQLGDGTRTTRPSPGQVLGLPEVDAIATGGLFTLAAEPGGAVWAWGRNDQGQLGDGSDNYRVLPVKVSDLTKATVLDGGKSHSLAVRVDGSAWAWGRNKTGQLGDGSHKQRMSPVRVRRLLE